MNQPIRNIRLSDELSGRVESMQRGLVKDRRLEPLIELHRLGFDLSPALHESMSRGYHGTSRALLDLKVTVTDQTEYVAACRGKEAFQLLRQYHRPGRGSLRSAVARKDFSMLEEITENRVWVWSGLYAFVPQLTTNDPIDTHHKMLRQMVSWTPDQELTREAMDVIARYAKPATLIEALHRSKSIRSSLIVSALCAGAEGNVVALREEGVKVSSLTVHHFMKNSLHLLNVRPLPETIANLLEFYRQDYAGRMPSCVCRRVVHRLLDLGATQLIHCQYTDEVRNLANVKRGLALLAACSRPEARVGLTSHVQSWIAHRNQLSFPPLPNDHQAKLSRECEVCFAVGDSLDATYQESPSP